MINTNLMEVQGKKAIAGIRSSVIGLQVSILTIIVSRTQQCNEVVRLIDGIFYVRLLILKIAH